ncbi:MAG: hypothetical protein M1831_007188 [Alyxoria varia]|nr:MAG: hypothetical protein M1831_007188 [Alyxoria varia]
MASKKPTKPEQLEARALRRQRKNLRRRRASKIEEAVDELPTRKRQLSHKAWHAKRAIRRREQHDATHDKYYRAREADRVDDPTAERDDLAPFRAGQVPAELQHLGQRVMMPAHLWPKGHIREPLEEFESGGLYYRNQPCNFWFLVCVILSHRTPLIREKQRYVWLRCQYPYIGDKAAQAVANLSLADFKQSWEDAPVRASPLGEVKLKRIHGLARAWVDKPPRPWKLYTRFDTPLKGPVPISKATAGNPAHEDAMDGWKGHRFQRTSTFSRKEDGVVETSPDNPIGSEILHLPGLDELGLAAFQLFRADLFRGVPRHRKDAEWRKAKTHDRILGPAKDVMELQNGRF